MTTTGRTHFARRLQRLSEMVMEMGALAQASLVRAIRALVEGDQDLAREVIAADAQINDLRFAIEQECYLLLATEQPVAGDMRAIVAALTVAGDLERIGDHAKKIAHAYLRIMENPRPIPTEGVQRLADIAVVILSRAMRAYGARDIPAAEAVCADDNRADALYKQIFDATLAFMLADSQQIGVGTYLLQIAHELERSADRATNIAERVIYAATGALLDMNP
jgi:phosphate transport system protein